MKKESLLIMTVKILLAVVIFTGIGVIIFGGGCIIWEYSKNETSNKIAKPVGQEAENYYDVLEKKCAGDSCCLSSLKAMKANDYKEVDKNGKCPDGFELGGLRCESSLSWCGEIPEKTEQKQSKSKWEVMEERNLKNICDGDDCCLSSLKVLQKNNNYIKVYKNHKCPEGFSRNAMICENSLEWCEPEYCLDNQNNRRKIGEIWSESPTMFMECNEFGNILGNYILSCGDEKLIVSSIYEDHYISPNMSRVLSEPFYIVASKEPLGLKWVINNREYSSSSGGPGSFFVSCDNGKAAIFYSNTYSDGDRVYGKKFIDCSVKNICYENFPKMARKVYCLDPNNESYREDDPENLTNEKESCQEIIKKFKELEKIFSNISSWHTYRNEEFGFEVSCPFEVKCLYDLKHSLSVMDLSENDCKITAEYISESELELLGIDCCETYSKYSRCETNYCEIYFDDLRCERFEISEDIYASINWGMEDKGSIAAVSFAVVKDRKTNGVFKIYLRPNSQQCRNFFKEILSTFKFIEKDEIE